MAACVAGILAGQYAADSADLIALWMCWGQDCSSSRAELEQAMTVLHCDPSTGLLPYV